jgi:hypothetical protein
MSNLSEEMSNEARETQVFSRKHLVLELDFSETSIEWIDESIETLDFSIPGGMSPENVDKLTCLWGAYLGEAIRKQGGNWARDENGNPGIRGGGGMVFPHQQVRLRLTKGAEYGLLSYFQSATSGV